VTEESLVEYYRRVWAEIDSFDGWLRYEELVADPAAALATISPVLSRTLEATREWDPRSVNTHMFKLDRHEALASGRIAVDRVGIWRTAERRFAKQTHETAALMGYG
jgi:hypothetical protein